MTRPNFYNMAVQEGIASNERLAYVTGADRVWMDHVQPAHELNNELLEALELLYMNEFQGNSISLEHCMVQGELLGDTLEKKVIAVIKKAKGL